MIYQNLERIGIKEDVIIEQVIRLNNEQRQEVRDVYKGTVFRLPSYVNTYQGATVRIWLA